MSSVSQMILGFDIGGANVKAATSTGLAAAVPFALWKDPARLPYVLADLASEFSQPQAIAVTMTAELADCFATKRDGVTTILDAVELFAAGTPVRIWSMAGEFLSVSTAKANSELVAASNWHALAEWCRTDLGTKLPKQEDSSNESGLLIDIGSTTTDIIPIPLTGLIPPRTDFARLQRGELLYTGVRRTPLCAVARSLFWKGNSIPVAAELFASTLDLFLLSGDIPEADADRETADGRPATIAAAHQRVARMLCCDEQECSLEMAREWASQFQAAQFQELSAALNRAMPRPPVWIITSGSGEFLAQRLVASRPDWLGVPRRSLTEMLSPTLAECAPAYAAARLLSFSA